jgi:hypothetical protein
MKQHATKWLIGGLLTILSVTAQADVKSDVVNKIPLKQIVKRALVKQEKSPEIAVQLINACVKPVEATKAVVEETPDQAIQVVIAILKSVKANTTCHQNDKTTEGVPSGATADPSKGIAELVGAIVDLVINSNSRMPVNEVIDLLKQVITQLSADVGLPPPSTGPGPTVNSELPTGEGREVNTSVGGDTNSTVSPTPTVGAGGGGREGVASPHR